MPIDKINDEPSEENKKNYIPILLELVSRVVENANAVSSSILLAGENIERLSETVERVEKKVDAISEKLTKQVDAISDSKMLSFFSFASVWGRRIVKGVVLALLVPSILLLIAFLLSVIAKGWPSFIKFGGH